MTVPVKTHDPVDLFLICLKRIGEEGSEGGSEGGSDCESSHGLYPSVTLELEGRRPEATNATWRAALRP